MHHDGMMFGWGPLWMVLLAIVTVAVGWGLFRLITGRDSSKGGGDGSPSAREILRRRFAQGDIDEDEYERRMDQLQTS